MARKQVKRPVKFNKKKWRRVHALCEVLAKLTDTERKALLEFVSDEGCEALSLCVYNVLHNDKIPNRAKLRDALVKDKDVFRYLGSRRGSIKNKRKKFVQVGGQLGVILSTVLPLLANYLFSHIK